MNTDNQSDLGTESNNPTTNEGTSAPFDQNKLADLVSKTFLGGEEREDTSDSENSEAEVQATSEDSEVHSQLTEKQPEQDSLEDSEETEETKSEDDDFERGLPKGVKKRIDKADTWRFNSHRETWNILYLHFTFSDL